MDFTEDDFNRAKSKVLSDFNKALTAAETLRSAEMEAFEVSAEAAPAAVEEESRDAAVSLAGATRAIPVAAAGK